MFSTTATANIKQIAEAVLRLSDFYIKNPSAQTPWTENYCQLAYRNYYLPLNFIRCKQVIERGAEVGFFNGLEHFIDWGCGPSTASLALVNSSVKKQIKSQLLFDSSKTVLNVFSDLHQNLVSPKTCSELNLTKLNSYNQSCLVFSYSITELKDLPAGWDRFEALMILEPSTSEDGRSLLELRTKLISAGYSIWAPCTHHLTCPLLSQSKHDWCHDRAHVEAPDWFNEIENNMPIKNKTVTTSYLLARRQKPPEFLKSKARLTGDSLNEKGKTRQLVCFNNERLFLTWMHKTITPEILNRGDLIDLPKDVEKKSNELRLHLPIKI